MATATRQYGARRRARAAVIEERPAVRHEMDHTFLVLVILMLIAGLVMVFSASAPAANTKFENSYHFILRQVAFASVGLAGMFFLSYIDYRKFKHWSIGLMFGCMFLLFLVLTPVGTEHNGSQRWLWIFQPSELMKFAMAAYCAYMIELNVCDVTKLKQLMPYLVVIGIVSVLMLLETHLSGCIVIAAIACIVLMVGGASMKLFFGSGIAVVGIGALILKLFDEERWSRVEMSFNPLLDLSGDGYQVSQGLYAIANGGFFGRGLGQSVQKTTYLPEPYNDFIFTVICEELGFVGALGVIALFILLVWFGLRIAFRAPDKFGMLTVIGVMAQIAIQTLFNIAVTTASCPCTGISLPFFSYGGTAIIILLWEMGFVLSVSRYGIKPDMETKKRAKVMKGGKA